MKLKSFSYQCIRFSMLAYVVWLFLPAMQCLGRSYTGAACVALFGLGVVTDVETFQKQWLMLVARAAAAIALSLLLIICMDRGGEQKTAFLVRSVMLWFPLIFVGHVRAIGDRRLWQGLKATLQSVMAITVFTTFCWSIEGMLNGQDPTYCRVLGSAAPEYAHMLNTLMLRNIGGYDFIYALVISIPLVVISFFRSKGWRKWATAAFFAMQLAVIVLSQYTSALLCTGMILLVECVAILIHLISGKRVNFKTAVLCCCALLVPILFAKPLLSIGCTIAERLQFDSVLYNLQQLQVLLQGGEVDSFSRLTYYPIAIRGFLASPFTGSRLGGEAMLSFHSDILDLLSSAGLLGALCAAGLIWLAGRGTMRGIRKHAGSGNLCLMVAVCLLISLLGTVVYSREITAVIALAALFVLEE